MIVFVLFQALQAVEGDPTTSQGTALLPIPVMKIKTLVLCKEPHRLCLPVAFNYGPTKICAMHGPVFVVEQTEAATLDGVPEQHSQISRSQTSGDEGEVHQHSLLSTTRHLSGVPEHHPDQPFANKAGR